MAVLNGNSGVVQVGANAIGELVSWSIEESGETIESTALGDTARTYEAGLTTWSGSCEAHFDDADTGQDAVVIGTSVALTFLPEGSGTGNEEYTGNAIVTAVSHSTSLNELVSSSFSFQGTGALTRGTAA